MKSNTNKIFISFVAVCSAISLFVIYILVTRPAKVLVESYNTDSDTIEFFYKAELTNPTLQEIIKRKNDGKHVILVLLTDKRRLNEISNYEQVLGSYEKCQKKIPCKMFEMKKSEYLEKSKERKY